MIRQGLSVTITPDDKDNEQYYVHVNSSAWDGDRCIASRVVTMGKVEMPYGVSSQPENGLWMTDFLDVAMQLLKFQLNPSPGASTIFSDGHVSGG